FIFNDLSQIYNGNARVVTATTVPPGLNVEITYNGAAPAPIAAGSYTVTGVINDVIYSGMSVATLTVGRADQVITFPDLSPRTTNEAVGLSASASSGLPLTDFAVMAGPGMVNGTNLTFSGAGDVLVAALQAGDENWNPAAAVTNLVKAFSLVPNNGPASGGNTVLITNGRIGDGAGIT
ncbi:MAG TPA: MBG domain-containing protein, partial [Kiritimatiellia bacterium]|nr:MBG domain-containing protein [Kiritimatiellia bacterium]